jgi:hypothetical protein
VSIVAELVRYVVPLVVVETDMGVVVETDSGVIV